MFLTHLIYTFAEKANSDHKVKKKKEEIVYQWNEAINCSQMNQRYWLPKHEPIFHIEIGYVIWSVEFHAMFIYDHGHNRQICVDKTKFTM